MTREEIVAILKENYGIIESRFKVRSLALFGSAARGEAGADSDVDVLVDFPEPPTFDQYMELKFFLEDVLHRGFDLVTRRGLRERFRTQVQKDAISVP
ncbi:MAG: nucleotidyltransferase family protein [bacterium]